MAKGNTNGRPKRSNSYKPYDTSNSFVKRVTSRVSELLPQPASWISRWLSSTPSSSTTTQPPPPQQRFYEQEEDEDEEIEEVRPQQPLKRIRLSNNTGTGGVAATAANDYSLANNLRQLDDLRTTHEEEISPILRSHQDDCAVPGPSGLHLRRKDRFVASTPALPSLQPPHVPQPSTALNKINGDDGSDSSDSTSGCSSLVPQADKMSSGGFSAKRTLQRKTDSFNVSSLSESGSRNPRSLFCKPKYPRVELPSTPGNGPTRGAVPTFDSLVFHSAHKTRLGHNTSSREDTTHSSPFYSGRTMYGGASGSRKRDLNVTSMSFLAPSATQSPTRVIDIKPTVRPEPVSTAARDTMGTTARKILDALEKFSTPVLDAKRIPVRPQQPTVNLRTGSKRKLPPHPYQELSIPQMPDLLRIKRREAATSRTGEISSAGISIPETPSTAPTSVVATSTVASPSTPSIVMTSSVATTTVESSGQLQKQPSNDYSLRKDDASNQKLIGSVRGKNKDLLNDEQPVPQVNLPNITLPLTSLPVFNINIKPPIKYAAPPTSTKTALSASPAAPSKPISESKFSPSQFSFKFSSPIEESDYVPSIFSLRPPINFSNPLVLSEIKNNCLSQIAATDKIDAAKSNGEKEHSPSHFNKLVPTNFTSGSTSFCNVQFKTKSANEDNISEPNNHKTLEVSDAKTSLFGSDKFRPVEAEKSSAEVKKKTDASKNDKSKCKECSAVTSDESEKCKHCSSINDDKKLSTGFGDMFKPPVDTWECKECFVRNKMIDSKCLACSTSRPGEAPPPTTFQAVPATKPKFELNALFKKPQGSWECSICLVQNKADSSTCVACSTPQPGVADAPDKTSESRPKFSFGISQSVSLAGGNATGGFVFSSGSNLENKSPSVGFGFASVNKDNSVSTIPSSGFKFGTLNTQLENKSVTTSNDHGKTLSSQNETPTSGITTPTPPVTVNVNATQGMKSSLAGGEDKDEKVAKKRVSFGEPLVEEKNISDTNSSPAIFKFGSSSFVPSTKSADNLLPSKPAPFGTPTPIAVTTSSQLFTFTSGDGNGSLNNGAVTKTTVFPTTTSLSSKTEDGKKGFLFSAEKPKFGSENIFADMSTSMDAKSQTPPGSETTTVNNIFGNDQNANVGKPLFGGGEEKKTSFFAPPPATDSKSSFFTDNKNVFGSSQTGENWGSTNSIFGKKTDIFGATITTASPNFPSFTATTSFPSGSDTTTSGTRFSFNSTAQPAGDTTTTPALPVTHLFSFKPEPEKTQQQGGFSFPTLGTSSQSTAPFSFNVPQTPPTSAPAPFSTFGAPTPAAPQFGTPSVFGGTTTAATPAPFAFGSGLNAPQQPSDQPQASPAVFSFGGQQPQSTKETSGTPSFAFGSQSTQAPKPCFDPNVKPHFNFSGGATPVFSATPGQDTPTEQRRVYKKAIRRTLNR